MKNLETYNEWKNIHIKDGLSNNWVCDDVTGLTNDEINKFRESIKESYINEDDHYISFYNNKICYYSKLSGSTNCL